MILNCFVIDDEPFSLALTSNFIKQTPFLKLSGSFDGPLEGFAAMQGNTVDVIFLDIEMPKINGLELASLINQSTNAKPPLIVFTTAYDHFALDGYKVNAVDYLLKPFSYEDFLRAAGKVIKHASLVSTQENNGKNNDHLFIKVEYNLLRIDYMDILYIEALKDYVKVFLKSSTRPLLSLTSLKSLEEKLPHLRFMRVHRSFIIALDKITSITKTSLQIGTATIPIGEQYKDSIRKFIDSHTA